MAYIPAIGNGFCETCDRPYSVNHKYCEYCFEVGLDHSDLCVSRLTQLGLYPHWNSDKNAHYEMLKWERGFIKLHKILKYQPRTQE